MLTTEERARVIEEERLRAQVQDDIRLEREREIKEQERSVEKDRLQRQQEERLRNSNKMLMFIGVFIVLIVGLVLATVFSPKGGASTVWGTAEFVVSCEQSVRAQLKVPDSAQFESFMTAADSVNDYGTVYGWDSTVKAQNVFGAMMPTSFHCKGLKEARTVTVAFR